MVSEINHKALKVQKVSKKKETGSWNISKHLKEKLRSIPIVGMVVTISPSLSLYKMVVLPAASRPTMRIRISFLAKSRLKSLVKDSPISYFNCMQKIHDEKEHVF